MTNPMKLLPLHPGDVTYCDHRDSNGGLQPNFNSNLAHHEMRILHDEGLYRHIRFKNRANGFYRFDLITWPGHLTISGDIGCYTFARITDMFDFFTGYINTGYWAEKLQHGPSGGRNAARDYDEDEFKKWLLEDFWETSRDLEPKETRQWWETLKDNVLDDWVDTSSTSAALEALNTVDRTYMGPLNHYEDAYEAASSWLKYDWHFELCLASIVTGIRTYNAHKKATT